MVGLDAVGRATLSRMSSPAASASASALRARIACEPDFIVADEALSALDLSLQGQMLDLLAGLKQRFALTYLFISHDLSVVRAHLGSGGRDVSRAHGRTRRHDRALCASRAIRTRRRCWQLCRSRIPMFERARPYQSLRRRAAKSGESAAGLRVSSALPARAQSLPQRTPPLGRDRAGPCGRLPLPALRESSWSHSSPIRPLRPMSRWPCAQSVDLPHLRAVVEPARRGRSRRCPRRYARRILHGRLRRQLVRGAQRRARLAALDRAGHRSAQRPWSLRATRSRCSSRATWSSAFPIPAAPRARAKRCCWPRIGAARPSASPAA